MTVEESVSGSDRRLVRVDRDESVAVVVLDRPEAMNTLSEALREQLLIALAELETDAEVRAIVLTGAGRAFCAGGDLRAMQARLATPSGEVAFAGWQRMHEVSRMVTRLHASNKVTVAAVNGPAAGLGCDLALCCDFVVAAPTAIFAMSYVRRGLVPDGGGLYYLPRRVGLAKAKELIYSARTVDATEAAQIGMADRLVQSDQLIPASIELARQMTEAPATALALSKAILNRSFELDLDEVYELGAGAQAICYTTDDHRAAVTAFFESRRGD